MIGDMDTTLRCRCGRDRSFGEPRRSAGDRGCHLDGRPRGCLRPDLQQFQRLDRADRHRNLAVGSLPPYYRPPNYWAPAYYGNENNNPSLYEPITVMSAVPALAPFGLSLLVLTIAGVGVTRTRSQC
jgi:hypothetical protein